MHPDGVAPIYIENFVGDEDNPRARRRSIRSSSTPSPSTSANSPHSPALERGICDYMGCNYPKLKLKPGASFWKKVKVYGVPFPAQGGHDARALQRHEGVRSEARRRRVQEDGAAAISRNADEVPVFVRGPWENEHEHFGLFRDGTFVQFAFQYASCARCIVARYAPPAISAMPTQLIGVGRSFRTITASRMPSGIDSLSIGATRDTSASRNGLEVKDPARRPRRARTRRSRASAAAP
jgi:hypothetical protein